MKLTNYIILYTIIFFLLSAPITAQKNTLTKRDTNTVNKLSTIERKYDDYVMDKKQKTSLHPKPNSNQEKIGRIEFNTLMESLEDVTLPVVEKRSDELKKNGLGEEKLIISKPKSKEYTNELLLDGHRFSTQTTTIFSETFSGSYPGSWDIGLFEGSSGSLSWAWPVFNLEEAHCYAEPGGDAYYYPNDLLAYMLRLVDLSEYDQATLSFWVKVSTEETYDEFSVLIVDQSQTVYNIFTESGSQEWSEIILNLDQFAGQSELALFFLFDSNVSGSGDPYEGVWLDDITLVGESTKPNLTYITPSEWDYPIVPSSVSGTNFVNTLYGDQTTYIDYAYLNNGNADVTETFYTALYVDGNYLAQSSSNSLQVDWYAYIEDYTTTLSGGYHTLKIIIDYNNDIQESNEEDNEYSREFYWEPGSAEISFSENSLQFGYVMVTESSQKSFTVSNNGLSDLIISDMSSSSIDFVITPTSFTVTPEDSRNVTVTFSPATAQSYNESITITHNAEESPSNISVSGEGFTYPEQITAAISSSFGSFDSEESYKMIGLPGNSTVPLSEVIAGTYDTEWGAYYDDGTSNNYLVEWSSNNQSDFAFSPGKGFWIIALNRIQFEEISGSVPLEEDYSYTISLHMGWNIIANPFKENILWSSINEMNGGELQPIHYYNQGSYSQPSTFEPYKGYYFNSGTTSLKIPYVYSGNLSKKLAKTGLENNKKLSLKLYAGDQVKSKVEIGFSEDAKDLLDSYDIFSPPGDFQNYKISLYNEKLESSYKHLMKEFRQEISEGQIFVLNLKAVPNAEINLVTEGLSQFEEHEVYLLDTRLSKFYNLKINTQLAINSLHKNTKYKLLIGNQEFIEGIKSELIPKTFTLYQNYPNPFNPSTIIRFALSESNFVTINIYNILGELVINLAENEYFEAGFHEIGLDTGLLSSPGRNITSGIYFYSITSGEFSSVKKMVLIK